MSRIAPCQAASNSLIDDVVPRGTLENVRQMLCLLAAVDPDGIGSEACMGLFHVLAFCEAALTFEIERAAKEREMEAAQ
jgi:hypothetical protein